MLGFLRNNRLIYFTYTRIAGALTFFKFRKVHSLLVFIGYPRSGSSTLGSMLDAHKNILVAHELNILKYLKKGFDYRQIFFLLAKNSRQFTKRGRISSGYNGIIEGQYNGKAFPCYVIGDKKAGATSKMLGNHNFLLEKLVRFYPAIKVIHLVRNPFDMIATEAYKGNNYKLEVIEHRLNDCIELFRKKFETIDSIIRQGKFDIFTLRHEDLIENPETRLTELLSWLNLEIYPGYLDAVCSHLYKKAHKSRNEVSWTNEQKIKVEDLISYYSFLENYSFDK